ncbi:polysaccharide deacetylase family protein [Reichenbachiella sp.]|uniref:polysaccharide deacetylase family protein n=1 Tax=Reichenbachiella sp. TaxID=2184521 RepID=UPI003BB01BDE
MGFYLHRIPSFFHFLFPRHLWRLPNKDNKIFLTFDDGPIPEVTDFVLKSLGEYSVSATFFLLGEQIEKHQDLIQKIKNAGHQLANHGYSHLDGRKISRQTYFENKKRGQAIIDEFDGSSLFRPPYGRFKKGDGVVLWSLMAGDFDKTLSNEKCLKVLKSKTKSGDIIVFHDNEKSINKLKWVLPRYLQYCVDQGFKFGLIDQEIC